jgi:hypothetical protein
VGQTLSKAGRHLIVPTDTEWPSSLYSARCDTDGYQTADAVFVVRPGAERRGFLGLVKSTFIAMVSLFELVERILERAVELGKRFPWDVVAVDEVIEVRRGDAARSSVAHRASGAFTVCITALRRV